MIMNIPVITGCLIDHGFTSVEADVWFVDGELLVAHDKENVHFESALKPLLS